MYVWENFKWQILLIQQAAGEKNTKALMPPRDAEGHKPTT